MERRPRSLCPSAVVVVLMTAAFCFSPAYSGATPVPGEFLLKFAFPVNPGSWYHDGNGYLMTGIPSIDTLNVQYRVTDMFGTFYPLSTDPEILLDQEEVGLDRTFKAVMDPTFDPEDAATDYGSDPATEYAEPNEVNEGDGPHQYFPNDTYFGRQWSLHNTGQTGGTPDADIDAPEAWMIQRGDSNVVIAIVDMGVNYNLQDLKPNIWINPGEDLDNDRVVMDPDDEDDLDNDGNGKVDDFIGWDCVYEDSYPSGDEHGSLVAHVLSAVTDNNSFMASVSGSCKLMVVKSGSGSGNGSLNDDNCAQGIEYAARNGADVINMSWSNRSGTGSETIKDACEFAHRRDCVLVASAGNQGGTTPKAPACWEDESVDVIAVAGTDHNDQKYSSSNYGYWIDVSAPSQYVFTIETDGDTARVNGTSFGAPIVSGIAALIRSAYSSMDNDEVIAQIQNTCDDVGLSSMGRGRVNAHSALQLNLFGWNPDIEVSTNGDAYSAYSADVAVSGDTVYVVWAETTTLPIGVPEIYFARSTDNGETWSTPSLLSADDGTTSNSPSVAAEGCEVYVAWVEGKWGASTDISFRYSNDYGASFAAERNATQTSASASSDAMDVAMADGIAHLAWVEHNPSDNDCYYRALEGGARKNGMYTVSSIFAGTNAVTARVDADGDYVHVAWEQDSGGGTQIMHRRNTAGGDSTKWSNAVTIRNLGPSAVGNPDVAVAGRYVYLVWDEQSGPTRELLMTRNKCNGHPQSWGIVGGITNLSDALSADEPRITAGGEGVDIVWSRYNGLNFEIYNVFSVDHGDSYSSERRVTFNAGGSYDPSIECAPGWGAGQVNYLYLAWGDNSHSSASSRVRFKRCEPRFVASFDKSGSYSFDDHDLSGWGKGESGGNTISITPGQCVSPPNALLMSSQTPGCAWAETPAHSLDLTQPYWLTTWLYLDGSTNDGITVMDNGEVKLDILMGTELVSGTGVPVEVLSPYSWYLIECCADPSSGTYDVYVNEEFRANIPCEAGPAEQTILAGDLIDGPGGYGTVRWDNLGCEGLVLTGVTDLPSRGGVYALAIEAFPNPFRHGVNISFTLPATAATSAGASAFSRTHDPAVSGGGTECKVALHIFDASGRLVRSVEDAALVGRRKLILWDGRTGDGVPLPSGAYFAYLRAGALRGRTKIVLLR